MTAAVAEVLGAGLVTAVGLTSASVAAAVRAGIARLRELPLWDSRFRPYLGACVPEEALPPLPREQGKPALASREQRLLRLALPALREAARQCESRPALLVGLPYEMEAPTERPTAPWLRALAHASELELDLGHSRCFPKGRAAGLLALQEALRLLSEGRMREVLVGGVDSLMDPLVLASLEAEGRLRRHGPNEGLTPGEGAAFLHLAVRGTGRRRRLPVLAHVVGAGMGREPGHRYSQEPYLGEGLAEAVQSLFSQVPSGLGPVRCVYAGFNGEGLWAKEWGVTYLRARDNFVEELRMEHPAENVGDVGAASGPLMVGLSARGLFEGYRQGPVLVWSSSEREERGAVLLRAVEQEV